MFITIQIRLSALDHESWPSLCDEVRRCISLSSEKAIRILDRNPSVLCTAPEDDDILRDINGNRIGTVAVTFDPPKES